MKSPRAKPNTDDQKTADLEQVREELLRLRNALSRCEPETPDDYAFAKRVSAARYGAVLSAEEHLLVLQVLAAGAIARGHIIESFRYAQVGAKFAFEHQLHQARTYFLRLLAHVHMKLENEPAALREGRILFHFSAEHCLYANHVLAHIGVATTYMRLDELNQARSLQDTALAIAERHDLFHLLVVVRTNIATRLLKEGIAESALREIQRAIKIVEHVPQRILAVACWTESEILFAMKANEPALFAIERCRRILLDVPFSSVVVGVEYLAARVLAKLGRDEEAVECLKRSAAQAREAGMSAAEARALLALSQWHARAANAKDALASI
ncbi:MAG: hypothetical protein ACRDAM_10970, partial [Casimicrobium sp.]